MAIGLISACGLCKEEVIAKSAGLDILAHSLARTGRGERREKGKLWNGKGSKGWKSSDVNLLRDWLLSWPSSNGDGCTHIYPLASSLNPVVHTSAKVQTRPVRVLLQVKCCQHSLLPPSLCFFCCKISSTAHHRAPVWQPILNISLHVFEKDLLSLFWFD